MAGPATKIGHGRRQFRSQICDSGFRKAKLYRFDKEGSQWKEGGVGTVKLLKHKETGKIRPVMRQSKTLKICVPTILFATIYAVFIHRRSWASDDIVVCLGENIIVVLPTMAVQEHHGNEKSCVWHATDFAGGELKEEMFCICFASVENCKLFNDKIEEVTESLANDIGESEEGATAANLINQLSVGGEDKEKEKT